MLNSARRQSENEIARAFQVYGEDIALETIHPLGTSLVAQARLKNGLKLILHPLPHKCVFAWHTWVAAGSRHEFLGKTGLAHLFEHLMYRGTSRYPEGEYDRLLDRRGAQANAATWLDWTHYHASLPSSKDNIELIASLEGDRLQHLRTDDDVLQTERDVVLNERQYRVDDDPDGALGERLWSLALPNHPYGSPTIGWQEDIASISASDCNAFRSRWYTPDRVTICVVGGFDLEHTLGTLVEEYASFSGVSSEPAGDFGSFTAGDDRLDVAVSAPRLLVAYPSPPATADGLLALEVALDILFGGDSGRIVKELVFSSAVASLVEGFLAPLQLPGLFEISVSGREDKDPQLLLDTLNRGISDFLQDGPTDTEIMKSLRHLEVDLYRGQMTVDGLAYRLGHDAVVFGEPLRFQSLPNKVQAITKYDVLEAAKRAFNNIPAVVKAEAQR